MTDERKERAPAKMNLSSSGSSCSSSSLLSLSPLSRSARNERRRASAARLVPSFRWPGRRALPLALFSARALTRGEAYGAPRGRRGKCRPNNDKHRRGHLAGPRSFSLSLFASRPPLRFFVRRSVVRRGDEAGKLGPNRCKASYGVKGARSAGKSRKAAEKARKVTIAAVKQRFHFALAERPPRRKLRRSGRTRADCESSFAPLRAPGNKQSITGAFSALSPDAGRLAAGNRRAAEGGEKRRGECRCAARFKGGRCVGRERFRLVRRLSSDEFFPFRRFASLPFLRRSTRRSRKRGGRVFARGGKNGGGSEAAVPGLVGRRDEPLLSLALTCSPVCCLVSFQCFPSPPPPPAPRVPRPSFAVPLASSSDFHSLVARFHDAPASLRAVRHSCSVWAPLGANVTIDTRRVVCSPHFPAPSPPVCSPL